MRRVLSLLLKKPCKSLIYRTLSILCVRFNVRFFVLFLSVKPAICQNLFYVGDIIAALLGVLSAVIVALVKVYQSDFKREKGTTEKLIDWVKKSWRDVKKYFNNIAFLVKDYFSPVGLEDKQQKKPTTTPPSFDKKKTSLNGNFRKEMV